MIYEVPTGRTLTDIEKLNLTGTFPVNSMTATYTISKFKSIILIDTIVLKDTIELVYKGSLNNSYGCTGDRYEIWKDVYGCADGKFAKIDVINGEYIPEQSETYRF